MINLHNCIDNSPLGLIGANGAAIGLNVTFFSSFKDVAIKERGARKILRGNFSTNSFLISRVVELFTSFFSLLFLGQGRLQRSSHRYRAPRPPLSSLTGRRTFS